MATLNEYEKNIIALRPDKKWDDDRLNKCATVRKTLHARFPYVITYKGHYGPGILDDMDDWCREHFGDMHGECNWSECEWDWDKWHEESGLYKQLNNELYCEVERNKDCEIHREWSSTIINEHFKMIEEEYFPDQPGEHSHKGTWTSNFIVKTGYDYGYQDYCFENEEDAFYFKIMWDEEASKQ